MGGGVYFFIAELQQLYSESVLKKKRGLKLNTTPSKISQEAAHKFNFYSDICYNLFH